MKERFLLCITALGLLLHSVATSQIISPRRITNHSADQHETAIAVKPTGIPTTLSQTTLMIGWNDFRLPVYSRPGYSFSTNGGATWSSPGLISGPLTYGYDPSVAFDNLGYAYYAYAATPTYHPFTHRGTIHVSRTSNLGGNWQHYPVTSSILDDKPFITVDNSSYIYSYPGRVYLTWVELSNAGSKVLFAYSTNQGLTWLGFNELDQYQANALPFSTAPKPVEEQGGEEGGGEEGNGAVGGPMLAVAPNGTLFAMWTRVLGPNRNGIPSQIEVRKSTNGGSSFSPTQIAATFANVSLDIGNQAVFSWAHSSIAVDPQNSNRVYISFTHWNGSDADGKLVRSTDGGASWVATPTKSANLPNDHQYMQWLTAHPSGKLSLVFYHSVSISPPPPALPYWDVTTYLSESDDYGQSFPIVYPVSGTFTPSGPWTYHYIGHAGVNGHALPAWVDHGHGNPEVYFASVNQIPTKPRNFSASIFYTQYNSHPRLNWVPGVETDIVQYWIYRKNVPPYGPPPPNFDLIADNILPSQTEYIDYSIQYAGSGGYRSFYYIQAIDNVPQEGEPSDTGWVEWGNAYKGSASQFPDDFSLSQNYPNPFNPSTSITYSIPEPGVVSLKVLDILGREVTTLANEYKQSGRYEVKVNAEGLSSGVYIYRLQHNGKILSRKMLVAK